MPSSLKENITYIQVSNSHEATGYIAHNFYDEPSSKLKLVGVTGTNGKTTIALFCLSSLQNWDINAD